jgi:hypothetical protein
MSRSRRDQRGRQHSGKKCPESAAGGCVYCGTGEYKRSRRRAERLAGKRQIRDQRD